MAGELQGDCGMPGLTGVTASIILRPGTTVTQSGIAATAIPGSTWQSANMPIVGAGTYGYFFNDSGGNELSSGGEIDWDGTKEVTNLVLQTAIAGIGGARGSGTNTVTITVTDVSSNPIQFATVSAWSGSTLYGTATTDASGIAQIPSLLKLNNGTYTINVGGVAGFNGGGGSLVVSGATTPTPYALTPLSITPSDPPLSTGSLTCADGQGNVLANEPYYFRQIGIVDGSTGGSVTQKQWTVQSAANGVVQSQFIRTGVYLMKHGTNGTEKKFTVPDSSTFNLPSA